MAFCFTESFAAIFSKNKQSRQGFDLNEANAETYTGQSSYATSFGSDYPGYGNYGSTMNMKNPQISSSYTSFGPSSESNSFGSTTFVNYPPTYEHATSSQNFFRPSYTSNQAWPAQENLPQSYSSVNYGEQTPISQHVEVTKPIAVPIYKKFPYPVAKRFNVIIPHPVLGNFAKTINLFSMTTKNLLVPVPAPYPVNVAISQPVAVPVIREIRIPIEKEVLYPVEKRVPVTVDKPVQYQVEKHYPVYVPRPYPVKVINQICIHNFSFLTTIHPIRYQSSRQ